MSQRPLIISLQVKTQILLTTVAGRSSMDLMAEGLKTWSSKRFYLSLSLLPLGAAIVKAYEGSHDVLYGQFVKRIDGYQRLR